MEELIEEVEFVANFWGNQVVGLIVWYILEVVLSSQPRIREPSNYRWQHYSVLERF